MGVGEAAATALALVIHELATNSLKYGALSTDAGTLDVACDSPDGEGVVVWTERGGPEVTRPGGGEGYGAKLGSRAVAGQVGGSDQDNRRGAGRIDTIRH